MSNEEIRELILAEAKRHLEIARIDTLDKDGHLKLAAAMLWLLADKGCWNDLHRN